MRISEDRIRSIIRREIILETMRRFRASLVPGEWDPEHGAAEELQDLETKYFGKDTDALTSLALELSHYARKASTLPGFDDGPKAALALKKIGKK